MMKKVLTHLALMTFALLAMMSCNSDSNDVPSPLLLSTSEVLLNVGDTAHVRVTGGKDLTLLMQDTSIVQAQLLSPELILLKGVGRGTSGVNVLDETTKNLAVIKVVVGVPQVELTMSQLVDLLQQPVDRVGAALAQNLLETEKLDYSTIAAYAVKVEGISARLLCEQTESNNISFKIVPVDQTKNQEHFKQLMDVAAQLQGAAFYFGCIGKYDENGALPNATTKKFETDEEMQAMLNTANWDADLIRGGYRVSDRLSVEVRCDRGAEELILLPLKTHDTWKWYFKYLGQDFNKTLMDLYFQVKSNGMVPPVWQLFSIEGAERHGYNFNAVFFAHPQSPIDHMEMSFMDIEGDTTKVKRAWLALMEDKDVEKDFGTFEQAFIFPKQGSGLVHIATLEEIIDWVRDNDITQRGAIMPIFRTGENNVIIPQIANESLVITVGTLDKELSEKPKQIRQLMKTR